MYILPFIRYPSAFSHKVGLGLSLQKERLAAAGMLNALFAPYEQVKFSVCSRFQHRLFSSELLFHDINEQLGKTRQIGVLPIHGR